MSVLSKMLNLKRPPRVILMNIRRHQTVIFLNGETDFFDRFRRDFQSKKKSQPRLRNNSKYRKYSIANTLFSTPRTARWRRTNGRTTDTRNRTIQKSATSPQSNKRANDGRGQTNDTDVEPPNIEVLFLKNRRHRNGFTWCYIMGVYVRFFLLIQSYFEFYMSIAHN